MQKTFVDMSRYSFEEFVQFFFARDIPPKSEKRKPWHFETEVTCDSAAVCSYYLRLFRKPEFLLDDFSKAQLEEGFWAIQGPGLDCSAHRVILMETELPLTARQDCIRSMFSLFEGLFFAESLDSSVQMWWDSLCYDWHCGNRRRERGGENLELQDVFFETLRRILGLDSQICQGAALHGLGHLHHPGTPDLIDHYMREHPSLSPQARKYALAAARFEVM